MKEVKILEAKEYFNKLQQVVSKNSLKLNYYETEADSKLEDISFEPNGDYEQILRLIYQILKIIMLKH